MTTDFILEQDTAMLTKGLRFKANFSMDYTFAENKRGLSDQYNDAQRIWVDPDTGNISYKFDPDTGTDSTKSPILSIGYNNLVVQTLVPLIVNYTTLCNSTMPVPSANMK